MPWPAARWEARPTKSCSGPWRGGLRRSPAASRRHALEHVAGPLVNVVLFVVLGGGLVVANGSLLVDPSAPDPVRFLGAMFFTNGVLLVFNLLPIYPLDGGQILRSLLWFVMGEPRA